MEPKEGIIEGCIRGDRKCQYILYQQFSAVLYGICLRYLHDTESAEDMLQECFLKIFEKIKEFRGEGSFEGWMRKLTVNTLLNELKKVERSPLTDSYSNEEAVTSFVSQPDQFTQEELINIIHKLPTGYRTVFNLYEIEGYSHQEIAEMMQISESTSKTQLRNAKIRLQQILYQMYGTTSFE